MRNWFLFGVCFLVLISSCKRKSAGLPTQAISEKKAEKPVYTKTDLAQWPTSNWTAKAKISLQHPGLNVSFQMNMRAIQNKAIWFSATAFGIMEVARGMVTQDSIFALDKINNRFYIGGLEGLESYVPIPLGLGQLQHFMMGRVFWDSLLVGKYENVGDSTYINGRLGDISFASSIYQKYFLHKASVVQPQGSAQIQLVNDQFKINQGTQIAFRKQLKTQVVENGKTQQSGLEIEFSRFEFVAAAPEMPMDVPKDAERKILK
jgi:hypothetical protein